MKAVYESEAEETTPNRDMSANIGALDARWGCCLEVMRIRGLRIRNLEPPPTAWMAKRNLTVQSPPSFRSPVFRTARVANLR